MASQNSDLDEWFSKIPRTNEHVRASLKLTTKVRSKSPINDICNGTEPNSSRPTCVRLPPTLGARGEEEGRKGRRWGEWHNRPKEIIVTLLHSFYQHPPHTHTHTDTHTHPFAPPLHQRKPSVPSVPPGGWKKERGAKNKDKLQPWCQCGDKEAVGFHAPGVFQQGKGNCNATARLAEPAPEAILMKTHACPN